MKYKQVQSKSPKELETKVQEMLDAGWVLCGTPYPAEDGFYQCMHTVPPQEETQQEGLTVDDIATLSLLGSRGYYPRRRW